MAIAIPAALSQALGGAKDPNAVVMAMFKRATQPLRELHKRVAQRTRIATVRIEDADPNKAGKQAATISVAVASSDPAKLAAQFAAMIVVKGKAGVYVDESKRMLLRQPPGTSLSLDAEDARPFDAESIALLGVGAQMRADTLSRDGARSLFVIDDVLLISVGVPILCALIPLCLPMIIEWGAAAFNFEKEPPKGEAGPVTGQEPTIDAGDVGLTVGGEAYAVDPKVLLIGGAALLGLLWYLKKKG